ncbi:MAG: protein kinase [Planctomycetota bacterium]
MQDEHTTASGPGLPANDAAAGAHAFRVGSKVNGYTLVEYLASGGMGDVFEARLVDHDRLRHARYALKLSKTSIGDEEAEVLQRLNHPHIVRLHDAGEVTDALGQKRQYVVMQLLEGATKLTDYASAKGLAVVDRIRLIITACEALEYAAPVAHHLDVKPSNILVDRFDTLYVCDFGGASRRADSIPEMGLQTPEYCAPEQLLRTKSNLDERSDVYALAVTLFELLAGVLPIDVDRGMPREAIAAAKKQTPRSLAQLCDGCDPQLQRIVARALAYEAEARYASLRDFREALEGWIERARSPRERLRRALRTRPLARFAGVVLLAALLGTAVGGWLLAPASTRVLAWESRVALPQASPTPSDELSGVVLLALPAGDEIASLAAELGLQRVDARSPPTWRRVYAELCRALGGQCRAIVFDLFFPTEHEADAEFADALRGAMASGTPVVAGSQRRDTDSDGKPVMSKQIWDAGVHWGYITLAGHLETIRVPLLTDDGARQYPSLALAGVAAAIQPGAYPSFDLTDDEQIRVRFWTRSESERPGSRRALTEQALVIPTAIQPFDDLPPAAWLRGFRQTDLVAWQQPRLPSEAVRAGSTIPLRDVLLPGVDRAPLNDKIVLVFDAARERPIPTSYGMMQPAYIHAATMDAVLAGSTLRLWTARQHLVAAACAAFGGAALSIAAVALATPRTRRSALQPYLFVAVGLGVVLVGGVVSHAVGTRLAAHHGQLASPAPAALALACSVTLALLLEAAARRFARPHDAGATR